MIRRLRSAACLLALLAVTAARARAATVADLVPPPMTWPTAVSHTLPNGLRVVVLPVARSPLVQVQLRVPAGAAYEPDSLPGLAALTAELLRYGTSSRTASQFELDMASLGVTLTSAASRDYAVVACASRSRAFENALELLSDAVINPILGGEDWARARQAAVGAVAGARQNYSAVADERLLAEAWAPHPYAHAVATSAGLLATLPQSAVFSFLRDRWRPDHAVLVVVGDVEPARVFAAATDWFGRWAGRTAPDRPRPAPRPRAGVHVVDVPDLQVSAVRVAVPGPGLADPAYPAWSLLELELEQRLAGADVHVALVGAREASLVTFSAVAPQDSAVATVRRIEATLAQVAAAPPAGDALAALRRRAALRYPLTVETLGALAAQWHLDDDAGLPADALARGGEQLLAADPAPLAARLAAPPVVLVLGSAAALRGPLGTLGAVDVQPLVQESPLAASRAGTPEQHAKARRLVAAAVVAHGGATLVDGVHTLTIEGDLSLTLAGQQISGDFSIARQDPDRFSFSTRMLQVVSRQVLVGDKGWSYTQTDTSVSVPLDSLAIRSLRASLAADLVHELRLAASPTANAVWRGSAYVGTRACEIVEIESAVAGRQQLLLDSLTHRLLAIDNGPRPDGSWAERRQFSDFRRANGLLLPYIEDRISEGKRAARFFASKITVNTPLNPELFGEPAKVESPEEAAQRR